MTPYRLAVLAASALCLGAAAPSATAALDMPVAKSQVKPAASAPAPASPRAPAAAEPVLDPMERLRQRLSERLAGAGASAASGTLDLQVGTRAAAHGAPPAVRAAAAAMATPAPTHKVAAHAPVETGPSHIAVGMSAKRAAPAPAHAGGSAHWAYDGAGGPAAWGAMRPDFGLCANGQRQSPIDIRGGLAVDLEPVKFDYQPSAFSVIDNGHTVQVNLPPGNAIEVGTRRFELVQFHFHRPSEERIDGRQFEMSLHLVHKDAAGKLAVVGVLLGKGPAHPAVQTVWNNLPLERNEEAAARAQINPADLLPAEKRYFTYMGSLTTPPCSEGVLWVVMRQPATLTPEQIELFARIYPMNARPVQPVAGRRIMQSQ